MSFSRNLPARRNPLLLESLAPYVDMVSRRKLGRSLLTGLMVPGTDPDRVGAIGSFDYAHLRAPLPKGIVSDMFTSGSRGGYYLMRRSADGMVSASGMFKAAFPWATKEQEEAERRHIESLPTACRDELAYSVWISPEQAVALGEEYGMGPWIRALLDPADIPAATSDQNVENGAPRRVQSPPKYFGGIPTPAPSSDHFNLHLPMPSSIPRPATRSSRRSASPMKTPSKSPAKRPAPASRKRKTTKQSQSLDFLSVSASSSVVDDETQFVDYAAASIPLPSSPFTQMTASTAFEVDESKLEIFRLEKVAELPPVAEMPQSEEAAEDATECEVHVHVEPEVEIKSDGVKMEHTEVEIEYAGQPPSAEEMKLMVAEAENMVASASESSSPPVDTKGKRKVERLSQGDEDKRDDGGEGSSKNRELDPSEDTPQEPAAKKAKTEKPEVQLQKERIKRRAYYGIGAALAAGVVIPLIPFAMSVL